jgi:Putative zinc-finger
MPHVDEGTLHALLDGELGAAEVLEVQTHFATCPACAARLDEARHLLAETERLVTALEPPAAAAAAAPRLIVGKPMMPLDPVVLIPDNPTATEVRRSRFKIMAWAAGFLVVVGAGFFGLEMRSSLPGSRKVGNLRIRPEEFTFGTTKGQDSAAAVAATRAAQAPPPQTPTPQADAAPQRPSPLGIAKPQAPAAQAGGAVGARAESAPAAKPPANQPPARTQLADNTPPPEAKAPDKTPPPPPKAPEKPQPTPPSAQPQAQKTRAATPPKLEPKPAEGQPTESTDAANLDGTEDRATLVARAAKATEELDRERMRERAAQATADLDRQREQEQAAAEAQRRDSIQAAQRAAPTIDQKARLSSRIGLDEAAHQLGGPLHAIDGMTRQLVGLVSPQLVPGSDSTRPVVRAVYVDRTGRTIYLDQQRVRPGQLDLPFTPQTGPNGQQMWMAGSTLLVLQGDLGPDSLRSLARRVR